MRQHVEGNGNANVKLFLEMAITCLRIFFFFGGGGIVGAAVTVELALNEQTVCQPSGRLTATVVLCE
jgi:hypothetical protein